MGKIEIILIKYLIHILNLNKYGFIKWIDKRSFRVSLGDQRKDRKKDSDVEDFLKNYCKAQRRLYKGLQETRNSFIASLKRSKYLIVSKENGKTNESLIITFNEENLEKRKLRIMKAKRKNCPQNKKNVKRGFKESGIDESNEEIDFGYSSPKKCKLDIHSDSEDNDTAGNEIQQRQYMDLNLPSTSSSSGVDSDIGVDDPESAFCESVAEDILQGFKELSLADIKEVLNDGNSTAAPSSPQIEKLCDVYLGDEDLISDYSSELIESIFRSENQSGFDDKEADNDHLLSSDNSIAPSEDQQKIDSGNPLYGKNFILTKTYFGIEMDVFEYEREVMNNAGNLQETPVTFVTEKIHLMRSWLNENVFHDYYVCETLPNTSVLTNE